MKTCKNFTTSRPMTLNTYCGKVTATLLLNLEQRSRSKRNKWRGPPSAAREGSSPFMPDCFLSVAEGSADRLRLPHYSNDTNRLAILDSDGPNFLTLK